MSLREIAKGRGLRQRKNRALSIKEIRRIRKRGYEAERELVHLLREYGYYAVRIPVSAPSNEPLPDVFATKDNHIIAFEVKAQRKSRVYFPAEQNAKLFEFLNMFNAYEERLAILAAKFPRKWVFVRIKEPGNYVITNEDKSNINLF